VRNSLLFRGDERKSLIDEFVVQALAEVGPIDGG
jgi:hypothetical protein